MLDEITPLILTYNEAPNIGRTLARLTWARDIVVVDSYSNDETLAIARSFPQVRVFQRRFDSLQNQWNYALQETGISSEWVLALDADYLVTNELVEEIRELQPPADLSGYRASFNYCIDGHKLRGSAYPPVTVLYRRDKAQYRQDGHAHRVVINGQVENLAGKIFHDDRKPLSHWLEQQRLYAELETAKLLSSDWKELGWADRLRRLRLPAPLLMATYCLLVKRALLDGRAGWHYAFQRLVAESILSLHLLEHDLSRLTKAENPKRVARGDDDALNYQGEKSKESSCIS